MEANEMQFAAGEKTIDSILHWMKNVLQYAFLNVNNASRLQSMCRLTMWGSMLVCKNNTITLFGTEII